MTEESNILLVPSVVVLALLVSVLLAAPFAREAAFFPYSPTPALGWAGLAFALASLAYSARKRFFLQGYGPLIFWKAAHVFTGYIFIVLVVYHSNGGFGTGVQLMLSLICAGLLGTGLWGIARQGYSPGVMTKALLDPVYKSEHQQTENAILKEIASAANGKSHEFDGVYQRHILPFISIKLPSLEHHKAILRRCFGPSSADPNAAITDLAHLSSEERPVFYEVAEKAVDLVELRLSKTYQRGMNNWLPWHTWLGVVAMSALFFHVLASFYYGSHG